MTHVYEKASLEDYGLVCGLGDDLTPDMMVAIYQFANRRQLESVFHWHNTGERIWAKTVNQGICAELGIEREELDKYTFAGMMIEEDRTEMTEEEVEFREHVESMVDEFLEEFDFDAFYAEKEQRDAEERLLSELLNDEQEQ
jgi:hypothetical protein